MGEKQHKLKHMFIGETPCISLWEELDIHVLGAMAPFYKHERREKFKLLVDEDGYTALHRMCMDENTAPELALEIVKELVDCGGGELVGAVIPAHKKRVRVVPSCQHFQNNTRNKISCKSSTS